VPTLKRFSRLLDGNGQPGLIREVEKLKETVNHMNEHLESLSESFSALAKSQIEYDATQKLKWKTIQIVGIIAGIAIPLAAYISTL
jgi:hypothetical protein